MGPSHVLLLIDGDRLLLIYFSVLPMGGRRGGRAIDLLHLFFGMPKKDIKKKYAKGGGRYLGLGIQA